ncbi:MAG: DUF3795 domain-containing protein [Candidatus Dojkabacteria bacterium]|nr:DUF3795 domain-containing protein [Candidatus Dojkabacteria bacterium]
MKDKKLETPCGLYCLTCPEFEKSCEGKSCKEHDGKMFWGDCKLFECCVHKKRLEHCGVCEEFPCKLFINHNDPSLSREEARKENERRQEVLRKRANSE